MTGQHWLQVQFAVARGSLVAASCRQQQALNQQRCQWGKVVCAGEPAQTLRTDLTKVAFCLLYAMLMHVSQYVSKILHAFASACSH